MSNAHQAICDIRCIRLGVFLQMGSAKHVKAVEDAFVCLALSLGEKHGITECLQAVCCSPISA